MVKIRKLNKAFRKYSEIVKLLDGFGIKASSLDVDTYYNWIQAYISMKKITESTSGPTLDDVCKALKELCLKLECPYGYDSTINRLAIVISF